MGGSRTRHLPQIDGARSGALLALICYANPQHPRWLCSCCASYRGPLLQKRQRRRGRIGVFGKLFCCLHIAAIPVLQIFRASGLDPGDAGRESARSCHSTAGNSVTDFFTPYLVVGLIPAYLDSCSWRLFRTLGPPSGGSRELYFHSALWEGLQLVGPAVARVFHL